MAAAAPLLLGTAVGTSLIQFQATRNMGKVQELEAKTAAKSEEVAAVQREADRKSALADAMASQIASAGARGVSAFEGSPLSIMQEDIRREQTATERDILNTKLGAMTLRARGSAARSMARTQATLGLLSDFTQLAAVAPTGGFGGGGGGSVRTTGTNAALLGNADQIA